MQKNIVFLLALVIAAPALSQNIPVTGVDAATLEDIVGTPTLVTIVLKARDAEDPNLQITELNEHHLTVLHPDTGDRYAYMYEDVKEVRVQGDRIEARPFRPVVDRALTPSQQQLMNRAVNEAADVFGREARNQPVRMDAAMIIASQEVENGLQYLHGLARQDEIELALGAYYRLYIAGEDQVSADLIERALGSGDRRMRASAARVAGLYREPTAEPYLLRMVRDRAADLSAPSAIALGRMGSREAVPILLDMLTGLNEDKAIAAAQALKIMGGDDVIRSLHRMVDDQTGLSRYRIITILFELGDAEGERLMREEALEIPTLRLEAAIRLAPRGDLEAMQVLRDRLAQRYDIQMDIIRLRARAAGALIEGGDRAAVAHLQEMLRLDFPDLSEPAAGNWVKGIAAIVSNVVLDTNVRGLMDIMQPALVSRYPEARLSAATAIVGLGDPVFRERMLEHLHAG